MTKKSIDLTTVGGRIKAKRLEAGLTQEQLIRRDLGKFREQLDCLQDDEREFFLPYITKAKCIDDMADELGISYNSTQRRISRIKRKIDEGMHPYDYAI